MTEKDYAPQRNEGKKMVVKTPKESVKHTVQKKETKEEIIKDIEKSGVPKETAEKEEKLDEKNEVKNEEKAKESEDKKDVKEKVKKTEAIINDTSHPISTKHSIAICNFIKGKQIDKAIEDLRKVVLMKAAVPMKGEIPHRKGMMSGRFPKKASEAFIKMLNRLKANANVNGLENPVITLAVSNLGPKVYGRFGRTEKKRTHVKIVAMEKLNSKQKGK